ncbi:MAG: DUF5063 domain-containing protein [Muribaculum sp.]|nr:DUF5063 domain-containing protein [Muribaculum sp.]
MNNPQLTSRLLTVTSLASEYCMALESAAEITRAEFLATLTMLLPRIYLEFSDITIERSQQDMADEEMTFGLQPEPEYYPEYVDEAFYDSIRLKVESLLGPDDTFLETFEEDMKYSDTPIAASISECLADIFQPLYNFISTVRDTDGESTESAYIRCHEDFIAYWSQTLCNVMRPLNHLRNNEKDIYHD